MNTRVKEILDKYFVEKRYSHSSVFSLKDNFFTMENIQILQDLLKIATEELRITEISFTDMVPAYLTLKKDNTISTELQENFLTMITKD